jgi:hypothetical protein
MTRNLVTLDELVSVRCRLREELPLALIANYRQFLLSLVTAQPESNLMRCAHHCQLPAIRWKLQNLARLKKVNSRKFAQQADELRGRFDF